MAAIAVHRAEQLLAFGHRVLSLERVFHLSAGRLRVSRIDVLFVGNGRRQDRIFIRVPAAGIRSRDPSRDQKERCPVHSPNIQTMPPWLVWRPSLGAKSAGGRMSAGSSERTSP